ncbi:hypothetical protein ACIOJF_01945 [Glutamicibacter sp. NPDC087831]|uniref:hypothetical protein n=1 Tax=Glutamicibacter sp. NPDC087831 TaxID=3363998 RepID=UPI00382A014E
MSQDSSSSTPLSPGKAQQLLGSVPHRPRREFKAVDHAIAILVVAASLAAGLLALSGYGWISIAPAIIAFLSANHWFAARQRRINEPRYPGARTILAIFATWLLLPIWRSIVHHETAPWPEALLLGGFAPMLWLGYYLFLLIRR